MLMLMREEFLIIFNVGYLGTIIQLNYIEWAYLHTIENYVKIIDDIGILIKSQVFPEILFAVHFGMLLIEQINILR